MKNKLVSSANSFTVALDTADWISGPTMVRTVDCISFSETVVRMCALWACYRYDCVAISIIVHGIWSRSGRNIKHKRQRNGNCNSQWWRGTGVEHVYNLIKQVSTDSGVRQYRAVECRQSLRISAINYSGRASELRGIINLVTNGCPIYHVLSIVIFLEQSL